MHALDRPLEAYKRRSQFGYGIFIIALVSLLVTAAAHHFSPSPTSPLLWVVLVGALVAGLVDALWCERQAEASS